MKSGHSDIPKEIHETLSDLVNRHSNLIPGDIDGSYEFREDVLRFTNETDELAIFSASRMLSEQNGFAEQGKNIRAYYTDVLKFLNMAERVIVGLPNEMYKEEKVKTAVSKLINFSSSLYNSIILQFGLDSPHFQDVVNMKIDFKSLEGDLSKVAYRYNILETVVINGFDWETGKLWRESKKSAAVMANDFRCKNPEIESEMKRKSAFLYADAALAAKTLYDATGKKEYGRNWITFNQEFTKASIYFGGNSVIPIHARFMYAESLRVYCDREGSSSAGNKLNYASGIYKNVISLINNVLRVPSRNNSRLETIRTYNLFQLRVISRELLDAGEYIPCPAVQHQSRRPRRHKLLRSNRKTLYR